MRIKWVVKWVAQWVTMTGVFVFASLAIASPKGVSTFKLKNGKPWFTVEKIRVESEDGNEDTLVYCDSEGRELSTEKVTYSKSGVLKEYRWDEHQTGEFATIIREGDSLKFSYRPSRDDEVKRNEEKFEKEKESSIITAPMISYFLLLHWDELLKEPMEIKIASADQMDLFSFKVFREADASKDRVEWVLRPSSLLVRMAIGNMRYIFDQNKQLVQVLGVKPLVKVKDSKGGFSREKTDVQF